MKKVVCLFILSFVMLCCFACDNKKNNEDFTRKEWGDTPLRIWYDEEAPKIKEGNGVAYFWYDDKNYQNDDGWMYWSLPIGNGYFGVNTFGRTETERLLIKH